MSVFHKLVDGVEHFFEGKKHSHTHPGEECGEHHTSSHRFQSFAPPSNGNAKWYVDGCSYFWAVSEAIERTYTSPEALRVSHPIQTHDVVMLHRSCA